MAKLEKEIHMLQYPEWTAKDNYARNRRKRKNRTRDLKIKTKLKREIVACDEDQEGSNETCVWDWLSVLDLTMTQHFVKNRSQSYERNLIFKKSKFVLNLLTVHYLYLDLITVV